MLSCPYVFTLTTSDHATSTFYCQHLHFFSWGLSLDAKACLAKLCGRLDMPRSFMALNQTNKELVSPHPSDGIILTQITYTASQTFSWRLRHQSLSTVASLIMLPLMHAFFPPLFYYPILPGVSFNFQTNYLYLNPWLSLGSPKVFSQTCETCVKVHITIL